MKKANSAHIKRLQLVKPFMGRLLLGFLVMLIAVGLQLAFPKAISYFMDNVAEQPSTDWYTVPAILAMVGFTLYCVANALRIYLFESTGAMIVRRLRERLFRSIIKQEIGFFDTAQSGELTSRLTVDVDRLQGALSMNIAMMIRAFIVGIGGLVMILTLSPLLSGLVVLTMPLTLILSKWLGNKLRIKAKVLQESISGSLHRAQESVSNVRITQAFNQEEKAIRGYSTTVQSVLHRTLDNAKLRAVFQALSTFSSFSTMLVTVLAGGILIIRDTLTLGELTSFLMYAGMVSGAVNGISGLWGDWMQTFGATERVFELLDRISEVPTYKEGLEPANLQGKVEFDAISFAYPGRKDEEVLQDFSLSIEAGEKVALVGPSGAGKSTVVNLLLGFYAPSQGTIRFDGIDAATLDYRSIRDAMAIVEQEPVLFSGTIAENIGYALPQPENALDKIQEAAKLANAHHFISQFPEGYHTSVGEKGVQLSGGQKQRIAIARAVIKNPKILILDEATSALDSESELLVQDALNKLMHGRTTIIIAHRYSTIAHVDKLVVLDQGKLIQYGTHQALIENTEGLYYKLVLNQMG